MHASAPYLYHKRTIPTLEDMCTQMRMYLKNKGASLAGLFILKQLFMSLAANILSAAKFHKLLKAGVPVLSVNENQPSSPTIFQRSAHPQIFFCTYL